IAQVAGSASQRSMLMVFEDVHWVDPTSLELLAGLVERAQHLPMLLLITARPDFTPAWPPGPHTRLVSLTHLNRHEATALVESVSGGKMLPAEVLDQILARTDGVPLFLEELTKTVLESG